MSAAADTQEYSFQAEIKQLLHLLAHSLYQSKEIAIRELISNASDALDKMRFVSLTEEAHRDDKPLEIEIKGDKDAKELIIRDNGIGMTHEELISNLGTIAHSGSLEFLKNLATREKKGDVSLIGQFGVGFYSAFMLSDRVRVRTRSYQSNEGWEWESDGSGTYRVTPAEGLERGTQIILHLKDDVLDMAEDWRLKDIIRKYSSFVPHPIRVDGEVVNAQKPIWVEPKSQVTEEQYRQFYQHLTHHSNESPLWHLHMAGDSPIQFRTILYCPPTNYELMGMGKTEHGISLCAKRILVQSDCRDLLPDYLRFLYGVVDSEDLPLNVSRETLQDNSVIRRIKNVLVKGVLDKLQKLGEDNPEEYMTFYKQFGQIIKEGVPTDFPNRERVAKLLRFTSSQADESSPTSLDDYLKRALPDQKEIYYLGGPDLAAIKKSPNLEIFRRRGIEVLFLSDPIDEFVVSNLDRYADKPLKSIDSADLELPGTDAPEPEKPAEEPASSIARVLDLFKTALGERVKEVRESKRLTESPCCLVNTEGALSSQMQRLLKMANQEFPSSGKILEINPSAPLIRRLSLLSANADNDAFIKMCALQLWSNAMLLEGSLPEPEELVARNQTFMEEAAEKRSSIVL
ncbi:molecular chaperone HtpG [Singulisphaera sp. PoT]|uniref:molecular chaperone HtpG n=1 Tax=Singulisphaera sp. PoT TaxID=3411797 RepID=UPI003BF480F7